MIHDPVMFSTCFWRHPARLLLSLVLSVLMLFVFALAKPLWAHGGDAVFAGTEGPYNVRARALLDGGRLDYSIEIRDAITGVAVTDAKVVVTAFSTDGQLGPWDAVEEGALYEIVESVPNEIHWRSARSSHGFPPTRFGRLRLDLGECGSPWCVRDGTWNALLVGTTTHVVGLDRLCRGHFCRNQSAS